MSVQRAYILSINPRMLRNNNRNYYCFVDLSSRGIYRIYAREHITRWHSPTHGSKQFSDVCLCFSGKSECTNCAVVVSRPPPLDATCAMVSHIAQYVLVCRVRSVNCVARSVWVHFEHLPIGPRTLSQRSHLRTHCAQSNEETRSP